MQVFLILLGKGAMAHDTNRYSCVSKEIHELWPEIILETLKAGGSGGFLAGMFFRESSFPWHRTQATKEIED